MNDGIFSRISRLITASANGLVDSMENAAPELAMEGAIAEMEQAINELRHELGKLEAAKHLAAKRFQASSSEHDELADKLRIAVDAGRDDLAEAVIARQMDIEAQLPVLQKVLSEKSDELTEAEGYIDALQAKRREMLDALKAYRQSQQHSAESPAGNAPTASAGNTAAKAEQAFERVLSRQTGLEGAVADKDHAKLQELEALARQSAIAQRLAKAKLENQES
ncbi:PspA/IM30 family protein [Ferrimonas balearica]|uniref:PspA/IM30 family protein n=1 Tax=Ferrimonas balearica TaxID=44012 RepID=UPI001C996AED|nr:PspA/IM30 family protein [Ferrimonas balearica]MBY5992864.1 PspA/IM30 family protein [Ferrimonas balearica]